MLRVFFAALGRVYNFMIALIVAAILGVTTWAFWGLYQEEDLQNQFVKEGQLLSVRVDKAERDQRSWRDIMSNSVYLTVTYRGKNYSTRFVRDTTYISAGDHVKLLYHPRYDAFRQPDSGIYMGRPTIKSRLIVWSTVSTFSNQNKLLFFCLLLSTATFFLVTGLIVTLVPVPFLQDIARLVFIIELFIAALFFSYDTWEYFQYYQQLKTQGHQVDVRVLDTDRIAGRHSSKTTWRDYDYQATIRYQQQERIIPISEDDFDTVKPSDSLRAYYDKSVNDFMSVDFPPAYSRVLIPLFFWLIAFLLLRSGFDRRKQNPPTAPN